MSTTAPSLPENDNGSESDVIIEPGAVSDDALDRLVVSLARFFAQQVIEGRYDLGQEDER